MTHYRADYRYAVQTALAADQYFAKFEVRSAWANAADLDSLPMFGVATPSERKERDTHDGSRRETTMLIALKRAGGDDLEEVLDDDSAVVEEIVLRALEQRGSDCILTDTEVQLDGGSEQRVGTLIMKFTVTAWLAEPLSGV